MGVDTSGCGYGQVSGCRHTSGCGYGQLSGCGEGEGVIMCTTCMMDT